jgi:hypothetical protein
MVLRQALKQARKYSRRSEPGRTSGAINALLLLGNKRTDKVIQKAIKYVQKRFKKIPFSSYHGGRKMTISYLSAALAWRRLGDSYWNQYVKVYFPKILKMQKGSGAIDLAKGRTTVPGSHIETAYGLIILQLPKNHLSFAHENR